MSTRGFTSTFSLFFGGALLSIVLNPISSSSTLCETRCENAVPNLKRLKTLWHKVSKRVGGDGKLFNFIIDLLKKTSVNCKLDKLVRCYSKMKYPYHERIRYSFKESEYKHQYNTFLLKQFCSVAHFVEEFYLQPHRYTYIELMKQHHEPFIALTSHRLTSYHLLSM